MPHIRVRGLAFEELETISAPLIEKLSDITSTPADHFTLEYQTVTYLAVAGASPAYPFFEVLWFDRGDEMKAQVANMITEQVKPLIATNQDICVLFHDIAKENYFENGVRF